MAFLLVEIVARSAKNYLRELWRDTNKANHWMHNKNPDLHKDRKEDATSSVCRRLIEILSSKVGIYHC
jgi:hypothetical protein